MTSVSIAASWQQCGRATAKRSYKRCALVHTVRLGPVEFNALFGYILGNRDGIDNWHLIPPVLRRSIGRKLAPVSAGSGVVEKNIEVRIGRRFKRQGRSWTKNGAE